MISFTVDIWTYKMADHHFHCILDDLVNFVQSFHNNKLDILLKCSSWIAQRKQKKKPSFQNEQGRRKDILLCLPLLRRTWALVSQTVWKRQGYRKVPSQNVHSDTILKAPPVTNPWNRQDPDHLLSESHGRVWVALCVCLRVFVHVNVNTTL